MSLQDKQIEKLEDLKKRYQSDDKMKEKNDVDKIVKSIDEKIEKLNNEKPVDK